MQLLKALQKVKFVIIIIIIIILILICFSLAPGWEELS